MQLSLRFGGSITPNIPLDDCVLKPFYHSCKIDVSRNFCLCSVVLVNNFANNDALLMQFEILSFVFL